MSPEMWNLVRKEWRERRWVLAAFTGWILCCLVYVVAYEVTHRYRDPVASYYQVCLFTSVFGAVFLAMKTSLGEVSEGTLRFSLSLPVSRERIAAVRLVGGVLTLVLPMVIGAIVLTPFLGSGVLEQAPVRPSDPYNPMPERLSLSAGDAVALHWTATAIAVAGGTQLLLILSVIGAKRTSEAQVGFCGAVLAFGWLILMSAREWLPFGERWISAIFPVSFLINYSYGGEDGSYADLDLGQPVWSRLGINAILLVSLSWWFTRRYGLHRAARRSCRPWIAKLPALWSRFPLRLSNETAALVWINLRQSVPLASYGLLLAAAITPLQMAELRYNESFRSQLPSATWFVAMLWAAVVGVGVFATELQPDLSRFWRSRPITVGAWFWTKFVIGLAAVLLVVDGVTIAVSWGTPIDQTSGMSWSYVACLPIVHGMLYSVAVLGICWLRRPIVGGALAIGGYIFVSAFGRAFFGESIEPINVYNEILSDEIHHGRIDLTAHQYPLVYGMLLVIAVASAWLAYRAVRSPENPALFRRRQRASGS